MNSHAESVRRIEFPGHALHYELRRSDRRTIGFVIDAHGLRVIAPRGTSIGRIELALREKSAWIVRKLAEWNARRARLERQAIRWENGTAVPLLGQPRLLQLDPDARGVTEVNERLIVGLPLQTGVERIRSDVQRWLRGRARQTFAARFDWFAREHDLVPQRWALSTARMRWGSCSAAGSIRLNWRLVHFPPPIIDYVIAHELAHLREFNHSREFWAIVERLCPQYQHARAWLREGEADAVR